MAKLTINGLVRVGKQLDRIANADFLPLLNQWQRTMAEDNRSGILAGLDKDGNPLLPVTYRPIRNSPKPKNRKKDRGFKGYGPMASGLHGNLSSSEYRRLKGPPLAPRYGNSRVITNFGTQPGKRDGKWRFVQAGWAEVVDVKGNPFLKYLLPLRDIRGVRPEGMDRARDQLLAFFRRVVRGR